MFERFPKLHSPYVRDYVSINEHTEDAYLVKNEIKEGYEWVFENDNVKAVEKLDGENVAIYINENGDIENIYTREGNIVNPFGEKNLSYVVKGVLDAYSRGWIDDLQNGSLHYGELIGPSVKQNPYNWNENMWVPFTYLQKNIYYESWGEYPQTFDAISNWFKDGLKPLFYLMMHNIPFDEETDDAYVEGIIFVHPDGRMAKLRRDMFDWYEGKRHGERYD